MYVEKILRCAGEKAHVESIKGFFSVYGWDVGAAVVGLLVVLYVLCCIDDLVAKGRSSRKEEEEWIL